MKTISFYNLKGGVGKTSFEILYASYLAYKHHYKVAIADFDQRLENFRNAEISSLKKEWKPEKEKDLWKIKTFMTKDARARAANSNQTTYGYAEILDDEIRYGELRGFDVLLIDLPGTFTELHADLFLKNAVGLCVSPVDKDTQVALATRLTSNQLRKHNQNHCAFINQIQFFNKKEEYNKLKNIYMGENIKILPDMISYSERIKKIGEPNSINVLRSTLSYPNWNDKEFEGSRDLGIENLFRDITILLDDTPDYKGTGNTFLSFAAHQEKDKSVGSINRQLVGTSYPELELELSEKDALTFIKNK